MKIEMSTDDKEFIVNLLQHTTVYNIVKRLSSSSTVHPENEDYIEFELTLEECEYLIGELSYEANHNRKNMFPIKPVKLLSLWKANGTMQSAFNGAKLTNN